VNVIGEYCFGFFMSVVDCEWATSIRILLLFDFFPTWSAVDKTCIIMIGTSLYVF
jgi:hypothetical protein